MHASEQQQTSRARDDAQPTSAGRRSAWRDIMFEPRFFFAMPSVRGRMMLRMLSHFARRRLLAAPLPFHAVRPVLAPDAMASHANTVIALGCRPFASGLRREAKENKEKRDEVAR